MRRSFWIVIGVALTTVLIAITSYTIVGRVCAARLATPTDDLDWLRLEFQVADADLDRIRALHEGYRPQCEHYCAQIAAKKHALALGLAAGTNLTPSAEEQLASIAEVRASCQAAMLQHFEAVSRAMPPDQGTRYLAVMRQLTLGRHEEVEASMSACCDTPHGHQH